MKILYLDLETTGTEFWKHGIHQISGAIEIDGVIKEYFDCKVQPNEKAMIDQKALDVANITIEVLKTYRPMKEVFVEFEKMIAKYVDKFNKKDKFFICGYNCASFDVPFFRAWFKQNARTQKELEFGNYFGSWFWSSSIDIMVLAAEKLKHERAEMIDFKLSTVAKHLGVHVDESKLHDAQYDIEISIRSYYKCIGQEYIEFVPSEYSFDMDK